jgi:hypothetical protein
MFKNWFKPKPQLKKAKQPFNIYVSGSHSVVVDKGKLTIDGRHYTEHDHLPPGVKIDWR